MKTVLFTIVIMSQQFFFSQETYLKLEELQGLKVGDTISLFQATNQHDSLVKAADLLNEGPLVVIFYRGQWCPYCNRHLSDLQDSLLLINQAGANVIAISPEKTEYLQKMKEKTKATFNLLYDKDYKIANSFGLSFQAEKATRVKYNSFLNANLSEAHGNDAELLPIPATYIIDQNGIIVWRQFDPNYKNRSTVKEILKNLP